MEELQKAGRGVTVLHKELLSPFKYFKSGRSFQQIFLLFCFALCAMKLQSSAFSVSKENNGKANMKQYSCSDILILISQCFHIPSRNESVGEASSRMFEIHSYIMIFLFNAQQPHSWNTWLDERLCTIALMGSLNYPIFYQVNSTVLGAVQRSQ